VEGLASNVEELASGVERLALLSGKIGFWCGRIGKEVEFLNFFFHQYVFYDILKIIKGGLL